MTLVYEDERADDLQIKGYRIIQKNEGFRFGMDAVLLSDYARVKKGSRVIDLCSGSGIIPILLEAKYETGSICGVEYFPEYVEMAKRSLVLNGQEDKIRMIRGDVREISALFEGGCADYVTCNPPYMAQAHGLVSGDYMRAAARHELLCTLSDVISGARRLLKQGGHFVMVHRPFRLAEILSACRENDLEPKRMRLVYPYADKEPNMVLIDCIRGARQRIFVEPPLIVYQKDGTYTEEILKIYGQL